MCALFCSMFSMASFKAAVIASIPGRFSVPDRISYALLHDSVYYVLLILVEVIEISVEPVCDLDAGGPRRAVDQLAQGIFQIH